METYGSFLIFDYAHSSVTRVFKSFPSTQACTSYIKMMLALTSVLNG